MTPDRAPAALAGCTDIGPRTSPTKPRSKRVKYLVGRVGLETHDRRIMRSTAPCAISASCADDTIHCTDGTHRAGII